MNVKKEQNGEDKQVDINTPRRRHSRQQRRQRGGCWPGGLSRRAPEAERINGNDKSANVNISGFGFGMKVVALEYQSDDSPAKLVAYYKDQLQKYGKVLECHTSHFEVNPDIKGSDHGSHELTCEGSERQQCRIESRHERKPAHRGRRARRQGIQLLAGVRAHSRQGRGDLAIARRAKLATSHSFKEDRLCFVIHGTTHVHICTRFALAVALSLPVCAQDSDNQNKNLDVRSSVGDLHVGSDADARKAGLPLYPGARLKTDDDNKARPISAYLTEAFGMKLVVAQLRFRRRPRQNHRLLSRQTEEVRQGSGVPFPETWRRCRRDTTTTRTPKTKTAKN